MKLRGIVAVGLLGTTLLSGCEVARVGTRCSPSQGPARNDTHVLVCENGRWKQTITIGHAAEIITSTWPANVTGTVVGLPGGPSSVWMNVTDRRGQAVPNAEIRLVAPGLFTGTDSVTVTSDAAGWLKLDGGPKLGAPGSYTVSAYWKGADTIGSIPVTLEGGTISNVVIVSGGQQRVAAGQPFEPVVFKAVDEHGFLASERSYEAAFDAQGFAVPPTMTKQADGTYRVDVPGLQAGTTTIVFKGMARYGTATVMATLERYGEA